MQLYKLDYDLAEIVSDTKSETYDPFRMLEIVVQHKNDDVAPLTIRKFIEAHGGYVHFQLYRIYAIVASFPLGVLDALTELDEVTRVQINHPIHIPRINVTLDNG